MRSRSYLTLFIFSVPAALGVPESVHKRHPATHPRCLFPAALHPPICLFLFLPLFFLPPPFPSLFQLACLHSLSISYTFWHNRAHPHPVTLAHTTARCISCSPLLSGHGLIFPLAVTTPPPAPASFLPPRCPASSVFPLFSLWHTLRLLHGQITETPRMAAALICHCVKKAKQSQKRDL